MEKELKVGQTCEIAVVTKNIEFNSLYSTGVILYNGMEGVLLCVGKTVYGICDRWVDNGFYKKTGKLTVTKVK